MDGIILIDKDKGCTSHDVVLRLRKMLPANRVGHSGTLDPDATGLLVILAGKATKLSKHIASEGKTYYATVRLGVETDSMDASGRIVSTKEVNNITKERIESVLSSFVGEMEQTVPLVSAVKVKGMRLYKYARRGIEVVPPKKKVHIDSIELVEMTKSDNPTFDMIVRCGSGTYIRSLASDIGRSLGCGAHLAGLRRLKSGSYNIEDAHSLEEVEAMMMRSDIDGFLMPMNGEKA